jgi:quinol monooxygenase YgiN
MWVRLGSFLVKPDQAADLRKTYNELAIPKVRSCAGNLACLLLEPTSGDEQFLAITIWDGPSAADAYEASGTAAEVVSLVRAFFAGPPTLRSYESASLAGLHVQV